jgi:hypothetical protein
MGALVGENYHGVSRSLYCQDPDGLEFEIMWELPLDIYDTTILPMCPSTSKQILRVGDPIAPAGAGRSASARIVSPGCHRCTRR